MASGTHLVFYGDDFTGSTDAMELLYLAGINTVLFPAVPTEEQLAAFKDIEAFGIAGTTRSMNPEAMRSTLEPVFSFIQSVKPRHCHYKVCSTFDSSPETGNIGIAMQVGAAHFKARYIPVLVGVPDLGRYCVFGHLFARLGTGKDGQVYRIDRHPSMSHHPVTPALESDIRLRLKEQGNWETALFDLFHCRMKSDQAKEALNKILADECVQAVLFDGLQEDDLAVPGFLMESSVPHQGTLFSVGSSAVEHALVHSWPRESMERKAEATAVTPRDEPLLVLSGSCSPVTVQQIKTAIKAGFAEFPLDTEALIVGSEETVTREAIDSVIRMIKSGKSVIIHTYSGPDDTRNKATQAAISGQFDEQEAGSEAPRILGGTMGTIARGIITETGIGRIVVAGGDTSGHVAKTMGIEALTVSQAFVRGAPLCQIHAPGTDLHGKEINFKGGQIGTPDYFIKALSQARPIN